ncbi:MAG: GNAT family N-acetyltransferase [Actinomycetota bacterium]|nr:GNAT family N-acetyltransferase [Actinomycetota bacterium]
MVYVRAALEEDTHSVARLNQHVQRLHVEEEPDDFRPATLEETEPFFARLINDEDQVVLVADLEGEPVGYLWARELSRPENPFTKPARTLYVHHVVVHPDHRRCGIGRALFDFVEQEARERGVTRLGLDFWSFNDSAAHFFRSLGFETYTIRMRRNVQGR